MKIRSGLLAALLFVSMVSNAAEAPKVAPVGNRTVLQKWTELYLQRKQYKIAEQKIQAELKSYPDDTVLWKLLGDVHKAAGETKKAESDYQKAQTLADGLDKNEAAYAYADLQASTGQAAAAESTLKAMAAQPALAPTANKALENMRQGQPFPSFQRSKIEAAMRRAQASKWSVTSTITTGYDSNTSLLPDASGGVSKGSAYVTPSIQGVYSGFLMESDIQTYLMAGYTKNIEQDAQSSNNLPLAVGTEWLLPGAWAKRNEISLAADVAVVYANTNLKLEQYSQSLTLTPKKSFTWENGKFTIGVPLSASGYPGVTALPDDKRDGYGFGLSLTNDHHVNRWTFDESLSHIRTEADGANQKVAETSANVSASVPVGWKTDVLGYLNGASSNYFASAAARLDTRTGAGVQFSRPIVDAVSASLSLATEKNTSNVSSAEYNKNVYSLKVSYAY